MERHKTVKPKKKGPTKNNTQLSMEGLSSMQSDSKQKRSNEQMKQEEQEELTNFQAKRKLRDIKSNNSVISNVDDVTSIYNNEPNRPDYIGHINSIRDKIPTFKRRVNDVYRTNPIGQNPPSVANIEIFGVIIEGIGNETYLFYMLSKFVLFDRRYINYNVYKKPAGVAADWTFQYSLVAYTSSSQVGSWRLCITEAGNRLNKFDDYVQSTTLHYKICQKMCELYYDPRLLWANEPTNNPDDPDAVQRNADRNTGPQNAIEYDPYVMEGGPNQYLTYPVVYVKTNPNDNITNIIVNRGIPDMFDFWTGGRFNPYPYGKCGDKDYNEIDIIKSLKEFSDLLSEHYTPINHTFLYEDRMTYNTPTDRKRFVSTAQVFLIRSQKKVIPPESNEYPDCPEYIDQICVFYTMQQFKPDLRTLELNVAGSYVQTMPFPCYVVNQLGLYLFYYKCGFYVCKPLEYSTQCRLLEYIRNDGKQILIPVEIIENYNSVGYRHSANYPFFEIYNYDDDDKDVIYQYREHQQAIIRELPINANADLVAAVAAPNAAAPNAAAPNAAAVPLNPDVFADQRGMQRFLTIEYPFLKRELQAVSQVDDLTDLKQIQIPGQGLIPGPTLSETGKSKLFTRTINNPINKIEEKNSTDDIARSMSLNKAYEYLQDVGRTALVRIRKTIGINQKDVPINNNSVPVIPISGGKKTNKNRKQYKNKRHTNKRKKCKQPQMKRKTMKRQTKKKHM